MILDTSGLFAFLNDREQPHRRAVDLYHSARLRVCHNYVTAELVTLALARKFDRGVTLDFVHDLPRSPEIVFVWVDQQLHLEAVLLLVARPDKAYSLCDAVSFVLMRRLGLTDALTTDRHFTQEGFARLLA